MISIGHFAAGYLTKSLSVKRVNDFQIALGSDYLKIWSIRHTLHAASKQTVNETYTSQQKYPVRPVPIKQTQ